jgi:hypothetical protein
MFDEDEDEKGCLTNTRIDFKRGDKEEINLYEEMSLALELMHDNSFDITQSGIGNSIYFSITTPYPDGLPFNVSSMFFNVNTNYNVNVKETPIYAGKGMRHFHVTIKKV